MDTTPIPVPPRGAPMVGRSMARTGYRHLAVLNAEGKRVAKCNPRVRLFHFDRGDATCRRCLGK